MSSPSYNNGDNHAWLMKIELKREEPMEINKDEGIKKATEDQVPATEDILQLDHNLLTPTEIEAFKMIELARCRCQNRRISGRGSRTVRLGRMVTGGKGHEVLPRFGPSLWR